MKSNRTKFYPCVFIDPMNITLTEETFTHQGTDPATLHTISEKWTAEYSGHPHDGGVGLKNYGPRLEVKRTGMTADEAYRNIRNALEDQGFIIHD